MPGVGSPLATAFVRIRPDTAGFGRDLKRQIARDSDADRIGRDLSRSLSKGIDLKQFSSLAQKLRDIKTIGAATIAPIKNFSTQVAKLAVVAGAGSAALLGGTGLVGGVLALAGSLTQVTGALPLIAPALAEIKVIEGTVKVATLGVADAMGKVLAPVTAKLSRNAQQFVAQFAKLAPALTKTKNAIQDAAFAGLAKDVRGLAERFLPQLTGSATALAGTLNGAVRGAIRGINTAAAESTIALVFQHARLAVADFAPNLARIPGLLLGVVAAAAPALRNLFLGANGALSKLLDRLRLSVASGELTATLERGVTALQRVGAIAAHVFSILRETVRAASEAVGGDLLRSIADVTGKFAAFLRSFQGQRALQGIFAAALPVLGRLGQLLGIVGPQLAKLAPVVVNLADAFLTGLAPVLPVVGELARVLGTALASVLPAVSSVAVALGGALTGAIRILQPVIKPLADALASLLSPTGVLASALSALAPVLPILAVGLGKVVAQLSRGLIAALDAVAPVLPKLAQAFADLAVAVAAGLGDALVEIAPHLPALVRDLTELLEGTAPLATALLTLVGPLVNLVNAAFRAELAVHRFRAAIVGTIIVGLADAAVAVARFAVLVAGGLATAWRAVVSGVTVAFAAVRTAVVTALDAVVGFLRAAGATIAGIAAVVVGVFRTVAATVVELVAPFRTTFGILAALVNVAFQIIRIAVLGTLLAIVTSFRIQFGVMQAVWAGAWAAITAATGAALAAVRNIIGTNLAAVRAVIAGTVAAARAVWTAFWQGTLGAAVRAGVGAVLAAVRVIGGIVGIAAGAAARFVAALVGGVGRARGGVASAIGGIIGLVSSVGSQILNALGDLGGLLFGAGSRIIGGLIAGIGSRIHDVAGAIGRIAGTIRDALPFSPAKVGPLSGRGSPEIAGRKIARMIQSGLDSQPVSLSRTLAGVSGGAAVKSAAPAPASGGVTADVLRAALEGMAIRFDGDGLARLVSNRQTRLIATGSRT